MRIEGIDRQRAGETLEALKRVLADSGHEDNDRREQHSRLAKIDSAFEFVKDELEAIDEDDTKEHMRKRLQMCLNRLEKVSDVITELFTDEENDEREPPSESDQLLVSELVEALKDAERGPRPCQTPSLPLPKPV